jgi:hypothetical protein
MTMPCKACLHPEILSIDAALRTSESQRSVARRFGLSKDGVRRHVDRDLAPMPMPAEGTPQSRAQAPTGDRTALQELQELVQNLKDTPLEGLSPTVQLAIAREKRLAVVELAKVLPPPAPLGGIDFSQTLEWTEFASFLEAWLKKQDPNLLPGFRAAVRNHLIAEHLGENP